MRRVIFASAFLAWIASAASAQSVSVVQPVVSPDLSGYVTTSQAAALQASIAAVPTDYLGAFTIATMPPASGNNFKRILVTDLGGGGGFLRSNGVCWRRIGALSVQTQVVPVAATVAVDGYATSPAIVFTGSSYSSKATVVVTNACSMPFFRVTVPAGVFSATGTLGLSSGLSTVTVGGIGISATWGDFQLMADGVTYVRTAGTSIP